MVARTLSLKGKLPLRKIWNKNSASFRAASEDPSKGGGAPPHAPAKSKRPRTCRVNKDGAEGIVFVRQSDLQVGPLLGEGGFAQVFGLFNCAPSLLGESGKSCLLSGKENNEDTVVKSGAGVNTSTNKHPLQADQQQEKQQEQQYAVKTIRKGLLEDKVLFQKAADDLVNEAEILARLDHPYIIKMRGMSKDADKPINHPQRYTNFFLLLDRLSETLSDRIQYWKDYEERKPTLDIKIGYSYQLAQALEYLHKRRILFRDIKPENIGFKGTIAQNDHNLQLFDFGMAREMPSNATTGSSAAPPLPPKRPPKVSSSINNNNSTKLDYYDEEFYHLTICGTQRYMSPEVLLDGKYTLKSDCYTWAMVVWEIIAEAKPFHYMTPSVHKILVCKQGDRPPLSCYGLPQVLQDLLVISWSHKATDRIPMMDVCEQLEPCVQQSQQEQRPPSNNNNKSPAKKHHRRSSSHGGVFLAPDITITSQEIEAAPAAVSPPSQDQPSAANSQNAHRRTNSHGSFLNNYNALRIPLADIPPATDPQEKKKNKNTCISPPPKSHKRNNSHGSFLSPPSATASTRLPPAEYSSPNTQANGANHKPAPGKAHRRNNSQSSTGSHMSRIPLGDLTSPEEKRASFVNSKPAPGKFHRRTGSHSSSLTNSIITRITRVPMETKDDSEPPPVVSPYSARKNNSSRSPPRDKSHHRRNNSHSSFLTNNVITRITRIAIEEPAPVVSPPAKTQPMSSPARSHRRSNSHGSFLLTDSAHSRSLLNDSSEQKQGPVVFLRQSSSWDAKNGPSLSEMQDRKKDWKERLKQYDICFAQKHGRMPNKYEKELIRPMYDHYNGLKSHITSLESLKNKLKQFDKCFARKHGRMPTKAEKEIIRPWYDQYKVLKSEVGDFLVEYEASPGAQEAKGHYERVVGQRCPTFSTFYSFDSDLTPEIEVAEL